MTTRLLIALFLGSSVPAFAFNRMVCDGQLETSVVTAIGRDGSEFPVLSRRLRRAAVTEATAKFIQIRNLDANVVAKINLWDLVEVFKKRKDYEVTLKMDGASAFDLEFAPAVAKDLRESFSCRGEF